MNFMKINYLLWVSDRIIDFILKKTRPGVFLVSTTAPCSSTVKSREKGTEEENFLQLITIQPIVTSLKAFCVSEPSRSVPDGRNTRRSRNLQRSR